MAWPFLTDILRRKRWRSAALPHRSEPGSTHIITFPSFCSSLFDALSTVLTLTSKCVCWLLICADISLHISYLLFLFHYSHFFETSFFLYFHQGPVIHLFYIQHITYFPHLLVTVLNVNHLPNNYRYPPDTYGELAEGKLPGSINHHWDNQANCCSNGF